MPDSLRRKKSTKPFTVNDQLIQTKRFLSSVRRTGVGKNVHWCTHRPRMIVEMRGFMHARTSQWTNNYRA
jgi:hypothetical protein